MVLSSHLSSNLVFFNPGASCFKSGYCVGCYFFLICRKFYPKLNLIIKDPVIVPTPYGGRLEWDLPSGTRLIAHLKDKVKIRHKKRWSQVSRQDNSDKKLIFQLRFMHMSNIIPLDSKDEAVFGSRQQKKKFPLPCWYLVVNIKWTK